MSSGNYNTELKSQGQQGYFRRHQKRPLLSGIQREGGSLFNSENGLKQADSEEDVLHSSLGMEQVERSSWGWG